MRYILFAILIIMNISFGIVSDASATCCGAVGARLAQGASRQSNEEDKTAGYIFAFAMASFCAWANGRNESKTK